MNTVIKQNWLYRMADPQKSVKNWGYTLHLTREDRDAYVANHAAYELAHPSVEPSWPEGEPETWEASERVIECLCAHARINDAVGLHFGCPIDWLYKVIGVGAWIKPIVES